MDTRINTTNHPGEKIALNSAIPLNIAQLMFGSAGKFAVSKDFLMNYLQRRIDLTDPVLLIPESQEKIEDNILALLRNYEVADGEIPQESPLLDILKIIINANVPAFRFFKVFLDAAKKLNLFIVLANDLKNAQPSEQLTSKLQNLITEIQTDPFTRDLIVNYMNYGVVDPLQTYLGNYFKPEYANNIVEHLQNRPNTLNSGDILELFSSVNAFFNPTEESLISAAYTMCVAKSMVKPEDPIISEFTLPAAKSRFTVAHAELIKSTFDGYDRKTTQNTNLVLSLIQESIQRALENPKIKQRISEITSERAANKAIYERARRLESAARNEEYDFRRERDRREEIARRLAAERKEYS